MNIGPLYTSQVPGFPLVVEVLDSRTNKPRNLITYTSVEILMNGPDGENIDTSSGIPAIIDVTGGLVRYEWPVTSLFPTVGDYTLQVALTGPNGIYDLTIPQTIEVFGSI